MLGNSFTFFCNMPEMLADLLHAEVVHHTRGGAHLAEQLNPETELGARTQTALRNEKWDYVVLQEYSTGPIVSPERFYDSVRKLCAQIRENGAVPVLYATWAFKKNGKKLKESGLKYEAMYRGLYDAYHHAAEENDALIADVGKAFCEHADTVELYASDDYHPSHEGSRLAAETIAKVIRGCDEKPENDSEAGYYHVEDSDSRMRLVRVYEILRKNTDEEHTLSTNQILDLLKERYGISIHRTTLPGDIEVLRSAGVEVMQVRHKALHYYLPEQSFSIPELRLLIDAVQSSKFITESKSQALIEKLMNQTSDANAEKLRRTVHVTGKAKSDNEKGYYIVDAINEAINIGRKISFYYFDYDGKKRHVLRNDGEPYTVSPYDLIWDGDYYYLTGYCDERGEVRVFRVDRIERRPVIMDADAVKAPRGYRVEKYTREVFRMFAAQETTEVKLLCDSAMMKAVIDIFGAKVRTKYIDENSFRATVKVCTSPTFYRWVYGWDGMMKIDGPEEVVEEYGKVLLAEMEQYKEQIERLQASDHKPV